jgi:cobalt-zinc-cadmium efflux system outer membrane protein
MHPRILSLFLLFFAVPSAPALTLSEIAPRVRSYHPQLLAARMAVEEARGRQLGAGRLPNPSLGYEFQNESRVSPRSSTFSLDQSFPITRRLGLEKQLSAQLVTAAELEVKDVERRLIAEARSLAVRLLALEKQRALRQQQTRLAEELSSFTKTRAEAGEFSPLDAAQAQVDAQRILLESRRIEIESLSLQGALQPMLGFSPTQTLNLTGDFPALTLPATSSWQQRADYQLAQARTQAAQTEASLAQANRYQDISAGFFAAREQQDITSSQTERSGFVGFRFSIPLPLWNRNQGEIAEKNASIQRARLEAEALGSQITSEADTARREMEANAALVSETRDKLLPLVKEQTDKLETAYQAGQSDLLTLLRARDQRLQLEATALDATRDFHLARIRYEAAVGTGH